MDIKATNYPGVMISSTFSDLEKYRKILIQALNDNELFHVAMENPSFSPDATVLSASLDMVRRSSAYILIIGTRYGRIIECDENQERVSLTELEFRLAAALNRPRLVFMMGEKHPDREQCSQEDNEANRKLDAFISRAKSLDEGSGMERLYHTFNSMEEFALKAGSAAAALKRKIEASPGPQIDTAEIIPVGIGPRPPNLFAHPRNLSAHAFVGRREQLRMLDEWAMGNDPNPVFLIDSIGGGGKSIIAWNWLERRASTIRGDWKGRFWYSFYERGAEIHDFLIKALAYTTGYYKIAWKNTPSPELAAMLTNVLRSAPWLIVLDGIERLLKQYNRFDAEYLSDDDAGAQQEDSNRSALDMAREEDEEIFQGMLSVLPSKILLTSRLVPNCLVNSAHQPLPGLAHHRLPGLNPEDAELLFRSCGITGNSSAIRSFLKSNCDCHPLVTGILAGLVTRSVIARGDFDTWASSVHGGLSIDLGKMDIKSRRNHILKVALEELPEKSRELLGSLALLLNEFDEKALVAISPEKLRVERSDLQERVNDLEDRGFLLFDKEKRLYDLHPVVRSVVIGTLAAETREQAGARVVDYFSSSAAKPLRSAETLADVLPALHIAKTLITMGKLEEAYSRIDQHLYDALFLNLEDHEKNLSLLRAFFDNGWKKIKNSIPKQIHPSLLNMTHISLSLTDQSEESFHCIIECIDSAMQLGNNSLSCYLHNLCWNAIEEGMLRTAFFLSAKTLEYAEANCNDEDVFTSLLLKFRIQTMLGKDEDAEHAWKSLDAMGREWSISRYRPGDAEAARLTQLLRKKAVDPELLSNAERIASSNPASRRTRRRLHTIRGEWHLQNHEYALAEQSFLKSAKMALETGRRDAESETFLALSRQYGNPKKHSQKREAIRLSKEKKLSELELALLFDSLATPSEAIKYAKIAHSRSCLEGEPWAFRHIHETSTELIQRNGSAVQPCPDPGPDLRWPYRHPKLPNPNQFLSELDSIAEKLRASNTHIIERRSRMTDEQRAISRLGHLIHKLKAKDTTGRWAYYFVLVHEEKEESFLRSIKGDGIIDLENFGSIIASCYGEEPTEEVRQFLFENYGFSV